MAINKPLSVQLQSSTSHLPLTGFSYRSHSRFILVFLFLVTRNPIQIWERERKRHLFPFSTVYILQLLFARHVFEPMTLNMVQCTVSSSCFLSLPDFASHHSYRWKISVWVPLSLTPFPSTYPTFAANGHSLTYSSKTGNKCASFLVLWIMLGIKQKVRRYAIIRFNKAGCHVKQVVVLKRWACQSGTFLTPLH